MEIVCEITKQSEKGKISEPATETVSAPKKAVKNCYIIDKSEIRNSNLIRDRSDVSNKQPKNHTKI